ncbi:MAG TPA: hypothetical protein VIO36_09910 [Anaerolineaceae bacterium]
MLKKVKTLVNRLKDAARALAAPRFSPARIPVPVQQPRRIRR